MLPCQGTTQGRQGLVATNISSGGNGGCGCNQDPWRFWPMWTVTMVNTTNLANPTSDLHIVSAASPCCVWVKELHFFEIQAHLAEDTADHLLWWELNLYTKHLSHMNVFCWVLATQSQNYDLQHSRAWGLQPGRCLHSWGWSWGCTLLECFLGCKYHQLCNICTWRQRSPYLEK